MSGGVSGPGSFKPPHESDTDSMAEYADEGKQWSLIQETQNWIINQILNHVFYFFFSAAKFTEDGSFIGQYGVKKKSDLPSPPTPMATFV